MSPNHTTKAVLSSLPSRRCASSTSCCAASFAGSSAASRKPAETIRTASESETGPHTPSLQMTMKESSRRSTSRRKTSGTALTTPAGCLYSRSPKPRETERPANPRPFLLGSTMRQMPLAFTTAEPSCSIRFRSEDTFGVWSSESRIARPSLVPSTTRLSPAFATARRSLPASSGPKKVVVQAVLPAVAQACAAPPSSLLRYWKKLCSVMRKAASKADRMAMSLLTSRLLWCRRQSKRLRSRFVATKSLHEAPECPSKTPNSAHTDFRQVAPSASRETPARTMTRSSMLALPRPFSWKVPTCMPLSNNRRMRSSFSPSTALVSTAARARATPSTCTLQAQGLPSTCVVTSYETTAPSPMACACGPSNPPWIWLRCTKTSSVPAKGTIFPKPFSFHHFTRPAPRWDPVVSAAASARGKGSASTSARSTFACFMGGSDTGSGWGKGTARLKSLRLK
mmetsp:Transcript_6819/g.21207  ORF Transcript_6819/g.21207 Transcript_6819/m.21207 type:complete len:454 (-) Transcript_6819:40-1401(-)